MGYILTPTQAENDNKLINNTLESLKTTNLLKQSQDTTINPNLSTQNTQTTQGLDSLNLSTFNSSLVSFLAI